MKQDLVTRVRLANLALLERGELESVGEYFSPDYMVHLTGEEAKGGHAMIRRVMAMYQKAFRELTVTLDILVCGNDRVSWQRTITATHQGPFKGFPATNRRLVWREMITSRFVDGLIVEEWFITDLAEQLLLARKAGKA